MKIKKSPAVIFLVWQLAVVVPGSLGLLLLDLVWAYSYAFGALIYILSNLYFTIYAFRFSETSMADWAFRAFKLGETGKFILSALGFALVFLHVKPLAVESLFVGFSTMVILQWFLSVRITEKK